MKVSPELAAKIDALCRADSPDALGGIPPAGKVRGRKLVAPACVVEFTLPVVVVSEANARCHWSERAKRFKAQRAELARRLSGWLPGVWCRLVPCAVLFTRLGGAAMDSDNLAGSCKALRDELADRLGVDDGDPRVSWGYTQEPSPEGQGVRVRVTNVEG